MRHAFDGFAIGADKSVIHGHQLQVVGGCLGHDPRSELHIRHADDEALRALRTQVIDRCLNLLSIRCTDFNKGKPFFLGSLLGELPLVLEPGLLRLLDDETDFHVSGMGRTDEGKGHHSGQNGFLQHTHCRTSQFISRRPASRGASTDLL